VRDQAAINFLNAQVPNPFYPLLPKTNLASTAVSRSQLLRPYPQFSGVSANQSGMTGYSDKNPSITARSRLSRAPTMMSSIAVTCQSVSDHQKT
jgi:hypothetical protein